MIPDDRPMLDRQANFTDVKLRWAHFPKLSEQELYPWMIAYQDWWRFIEPNTVTVFLRGWTSYGI